MTRYSDVWDGTKKSMIQLLDYMINEMKEQYPELTKQERTALFCESLARNIVQAELFEMMAYIADSE